MVDELKKLLENQIDLFMKKIMFVILAMVGLASTLFNGRDNPRAKEVRAST